MGYIERKPITVHQLTCSHPKVKRIWEYGGSAAIPTDGTLVRNLCVLLEGEHEPIIFSDYADGWAETQAEEYLNSLDK